MSKAAQNKGQNGSVQKQEEQKKKDDDGSKLLRELKQKSLRQHKINKYCLYVCYMMAAVAISVQLGGKSESFDEFISSIFKNSGNVQLTTWFIIVHTIVRPRLQKQYKQRTKPLQDFEKDEKSKAKYQQNVKDALIFDYAADVFHCLEVFLIFVATILMTINDPTFNHIAIILVVGLSLAVLIASKVRKMQYNRRKAQIQQKYFPNSHPQGDKVQEDKNHGASDPIKETLIAINTARQ